MSDFYVGEKSNQEAKQFLKDRKRGTFLVRYSINNKKYYLITKRKHQNNFSMPISEVVDYKLFYIHEGFSYYSIPELVSSYQGSEEMELKYPVNLPESYKNNTLETEVSTEISAIMQQTLLHDKNDFGEDVELLDYNHGRMNMDNAEECLKDKQKGTFLIRLHI